MTRQWQQTIQYDTNECTAERPRSRVPVDGPDAPIDPRVAQMLVDAYREGLRNPCIVVRAILSM